MPLVSRARCSRRAIAHARAAGDLDTPTELVAAEATRAINEGMIEAVLGWLDGFEQMQIESQSISATSCIIAIEAVSNRRLLEPIVNIPTTEAEQRYYAMLERPTRTA